MNFPLLLFHEDKILSFHRNCVFFFLNGGGDGNLIFLAILRMTFCHLHITVYVSKTWMWQTLPDRQPSVK